MTNRNQAIVPASRGVVTRTARALAPALARAFSRQIANNVYSSLPSWEQVGKTAKRIKDGYNSGSTAPIVQPMAAPVALAMPRRSRSAIVKQGKGSTMITHRELVVSNLLGSQTWIKQKIFYLNPGLAELFPWLSTMAINYTLYKFHKLEFEFVPTVGSSTQGEIILTPEYDPSAADITSEAQAVDHKDSVADVPWRCLRARLSAKDLHALGPKKFIRSTVTASDLKTFDAGKLYVSTNNCVNSAALGKLYVHYTVELFTPVLEPATPTTTTTIMDWLAAAQTLSSGAVTAIQFDMTSTYSANLPVNKPVLGSYIFPKGVYKIDYCVNFQDSINETFTTAVTPYEAGTAISTRYGTAIGNTSGVATQQRSSTSAFIYYADGLKTFQLMAQATGAAGVLTIQSATLCAQLISN